MPLRRILGRIRNLPLLFTVYILNSFKRRKNGNKPIVYFDLTNNYWHRYLLMLCYFFRIEGYRIVVRPNFRFLSNWATIQLIKQLPEISIASKKKHELFISDNPVQPEAKQLSFDYFNFNHQPGAYLVPMPMVDTMYHFELYKKARVLSKNQSRGIKIFFVGNVADSYANPTIKGKFNLLDRQEYLKVLFSQFSSFIKDYPKDDIKLTNHKADIVIIDRKTHNINPNKLLEVLSNCDFVLIPPGVVMPQTHFLVEAMSVGCIPILQYGQMFEKALDSSNSIKFSDKLNLAGQINNVLNCDKKNIHSLRRNVTNYYEKYLIPARVVDRIKHSSTRKIILNAEAASVDLI